MEKIRNKIPIYPEFSAVGAKNPNKPSRAIQAAIEAFKIENLRRIIEVGCGLLSNTPYLLNSFPVVVLVDTEKQYNRIKNNINKLMRRYSSLKKFIDANSFMHQKLEFDGAIIINVLHVIPEIKQRKNILFAAYNNLKDKGFVFIDVPRNETYYRCLVKTAQPYNDGFIMKRGNFFTFYKNMTFSELKSYAEEIGFKFYRRIYLDHRITFICQKII
ncbi:MAG: hypothetical protein ACTSPW_20705 [Promethearchaeota archaeon]